MPSSVGYRHLTLKKYVDDTFETPVRLLQDENGQYLYGWVLAEPPAPKVIESDVNYSAYRNDQMLTASQRDFSGGALQTYHDELLPIRYALSDGIHTQTPNEISLGPAVRDVTYGTRNGACQLKATTNWSVSGVTLTAVTTDPHTGEYHFQGADWSTNNYCELSLVQTEQPAARLQSVLINVTARVKNASDATGTMRLQIVESGGSSTPTTSGSTTALTTSYQTLSASVTLQSDSTGVVIRLQMVADGGSDRTVYFDSVQMVAGSSGDSSPNTNNAQMKQLGTNLLCVTDRSIWKFDDTGDYWCLQKAFGAEITGVETFANRVFVAFGASTAYQYSDAGDPATWNTASGGSTYQPRAVLFGQGLNASGVWTMYKTIDDKAVYVGTDPTDVTTWGSSVTVGSDDFAINQLYTLDGAVGVGKEDGLYRYMAPTNNQFQNAYPGGNHMPSPENFSRGIMFNGYFYTILGETGLAGYRFSSNDGHTWVEMDHVIRSPGFSEFGNRVRAFGTDGHWLYMLVEDLNADSLTKKCWLFALEIREEGPIVHTICSLVMSDGLDIFVHKPSGSTNRFVYISGDINDEAYCYRLQLPNRTDEPRLGTNIDLALTGYIITPYMDWTRPNIRKSMDRLFAVSENLTASKKIDVSYQLDNDTTFTNVHSSAYTFTSSPIQSMAFDAGIVGRRLRFKFTMSTDDATASPVLKTYTLESAWRPPRLRKWTFVIAIEEGNRHGSMVSMAMPSAKLMQNMNILSKEGSPIRFTDLDGVTWTGHIIEMSEVQVKGSTREGADSYVRGLQVVILQSNAETALPWGDIWWGQFHWG